MQGIALGSSLACGYGNINTYYTGPEYGNIAKEKKHLLLCILAWLLTEW